MAQRKRIGLREARALAPGAEIWDAAVPGFGARRQRSEVVSYVLMYRTREGRQRRYTIGRHAAPWTPDSARDEARRLLGEIVQRVGSGRRQAANSRGNDRRRTVRRPSCRRAGGPAADAPRAGKESQHARNRRGADRAPHPLLGRMAVPAVDRTDIEHFMQSWLI